MGEMRLLGSVPAVPGATSVGIPLAVEQLGTPGVRAIIIIEPVFKEGTNQGKDGLHDSSERTFSIRTLLAKQQSPITNIKANFTKFDGASYLSVSTNNNALKGGTPGGEFQIEINAARELSVVSMQIVATNPTEARNRFLHFISPAIDHISYVFNVPIFFSTIAVRDEKNGVQVVEYVSPFRTGIIDELRVSMVEEMLPVYAMYREGRNSNSAYYQFLCYYKIMDGLTGMKARAVKKAKKEKIDLKLPEERVPAHDDIAPWILPYVGEPIKQFKDMVLTKQYRDAVAHFALIDGRRLHVSSPQEVERYEQIAFACELSVRVLIDNHEKLLAILKSAS